MIRKLKSGWRIYSRRKDPKTGKRRNLGTFATREAAQKHERDKLVDIVRKTWGKMSERGRAAAAGLALSPELAAIVADAVR